jgi:DNA processing protein
MGRDVFALPGSIHAPLSRGCHRMLKQGAKLIETPQEILEELGFVPPAVTPSKGAAVPDDGRPPRRTSAPTPAATTTGASELAPDAQKLLAALGYAPTTLEILAARTDMQEATLQSTLLQLELAGHLTVLPGGQCVRASHG